MVFVISQSILLHIATTQACPSVSDQILSVIVIPASMSLSALLLATRWQIREMIFYTAILAIRLIPSLTVVHVLTASCRQQQCYSAGRPGPASSHFSATCLCYYTMCQLGHGEPRVAHCSSSDADAASGTGYQW